MTSLEIKYFKENSCIISLIIHFIEFVNEEIKLKLD